MVTVITIITGAGITRSAIIGMGMATAGTDIGIGVIAIAGLHGVMATLSASAAERR